MENIYSVSSDPKLYKSHKKGIFSDDSFYNQDGYMNNSSYLSKHIDLKNIINSPVFLMNNISSTE